MDLYELKRKLEEKKEREYFNRMKRTLNTRILDTIRPQWRCHSTLRGWSTINYPSLLESKRKFKTPHKEKDDSQNQYGTPSPPICKKRPISYETELKAIKMENDPLYAEAYFTKIGKVSIVDMKKKYQAIMAENKQFRSISKNSPATLTTCTYEQRKDIIEKFNKASEDVSVLKPISAIIGPKKDLLNFRKVKQLNEIEFNNSESDEDEDTYVYKVVFYKIL